MIAPKTKRIFCISNEPLIFANTLNITAFLLCSIIVCRFIKNIFNCLILMNYCMTVTHKFDVYEILRRHLFTHASNIIFRDIFFSKLQDAEPARSLITANVTFSGLDMKEFYGFSILSPVPFQKPVL